MNRQYRFQAPLPTIANCLSLSLDELATEKRRQQVIRGTAATLECMLGAVGGYGYAALLGFRPGMTNTEALRAFVEREIEDINDPPVIPMLLKQIRRALDRAQSFEDDY